jgi:hypothetical protein
MIKIDPHTDHVVIEGVTIRRPSRLSISQWLEQWEAHVKALRILETFTSKRLI